jgi:hypothetical protein
MRVDIDWLQDHLDTSLRRSLKKHSPVIRLRNGGQVSAQASQHHWCEPKRDKGPYTSCEVLNHGCRENDLYSLPNFEDNDNQPHGWVPLETVVDLINFNGGVKK